MNKFEFIKQYEKFCCGTNAIDPDEVIYQFSSILSFVGDEQFYAKDGRFSELISRWENRELSTEELAAVIKSEFGGEYEAAKREVAQYGNFFAELDKRVDEFFIERGYAKRGNDKYHSEDGAVLKGIEVVFYPCMYDNLILRVFPSIRCHRAEVKDGTINVECYEPDAKSKQKRVYKTVPKEEFDELVDLDGHSACRSISALRSRSISCPEMFEVDNGTLNASYRNLCESGDDRIMVSNAEELFEKIEPFLDAACSIIDKQKPNETYLELVRTRNRVKFKPSSKYILRLAAIPILTGFPMGVLVLLLDLLVGNLPPFHFAVYLKAALFTGLGFTLLFALIFGAVYLWGHLTTERF